MSSSSANDWPNNAHRTQGTGANTATPPPAVEAPPATPQASTTGAWPGDRHGCARYVSLTEPSTACVAFRDVISDVISNEEGTEMLATDGACQPPSDGYIGLAGSAHSRAPAPPY
jgi:hypothetical protein